MNLLNELLERIERQNRDKKARIHCSLLHLSHLLINQMGVPKLSLVVIESIRETFIILGSHLIDPSLINFLIIFIDSLIH